MSARIIAVTNQKGGVGKTTTVINLAALWARFAGNGRILVVDMDPQSSLSELFLGSEFTINRHNPEMPTIKDVLQGLPIQKAIYEVELEAVGQYNASTLHVIPSRDELREIEMVLPSTTNGMFILADQLYNIRDAYDTIILDCPASLGTFTQTALFAATEVVIPVSPGKFELRGLVNLREEIEKAQSPRVNPNLRITGVIPLRTDRTNLAKQTRDSLAQYFPNLILPSVPNRVAVAEAHAAAMDIFEYSPSDDAAGAYEAVLAELIRRGQHG
ncbi:MAG: ParA family protein [Chloroflexota bacterium]